MEFVFFSQLTNLSLSRRQRSMLLIRNRKSINNIFVNQNITKRVQNVKNIMDQEKTNKHIYINQNTPKHGTLTFKDPKRHKHMHQERTNIM